MKKILVVLILFISLIGLGSCGIIVTPPDDDNPPVDIKPELHTVTFKDGESVVSTKNVEHDKTLDDVPAPSKEGYSFKGWSTNKDEFIAFDVSSKITKDVTLYAFFDKNIKYYSIAFQTDGGSSIPRQTIEENKTVQIPAEPIKDGYVFKGWSTKKEEYVEYDFKKPVTADLTLYAHYSIKKVTVKFYNDSVEYKVEEINYNSLITLPSNPTKEGYEFIGWSTNKDRYVSFDFTKPIKENVTFYAFYNRDVPPLDTPDPDTVYTGYYESITGHLDETFKDTLHKLLKSTHKNKLSYTPGVWDALKKADQDPNNEDNILCIYTGQSISKNDRDGSSSAPIVWNREHSWPKSHGFSTQDYYAYTDIHHLFASEKGINNNRANKDFNYVVDGKSDIYGNKWNNTYFEPRDEVKGDLARAMFYMVVRYNDPTELVLELSESSTGASSNKTGLLGTLSVLLEWNLLDPVSDEERARNEVVYEIQGNRNPFIDHPEWIGLLYPSDEEQKNDELSIHFLELGNYYAGDSVYIKAGEYDILIDAGSRASSSTTIKNYINQYCTDGKLEYVIATHAHEDHISGFVGNSSNPGILDLYECDVIIDYALKNTTSKISAEYEAKRDRLVASGTTHYTAKDCVDGTNGATSKFQLTENISFEILNQKYYHQKSSDENNYSVCLQFNYEEEYFLFTGDLEEAGEASLVELNALPHCKVFKGGHHGSKTSSNEALLAAITPEVVCVCCCAGSSEYTNNLDNMFPTQAFIDRVALHTERIYVTTLATYEIATSGDMEYPKVNGFKSMNGNIVVTLDKEKEVIVNCSNNDIILKNSEWFNSFITLNGVERRMRTWPSFGK